MCDFKPNQTLNLALSSLLDDIEQVLKRLALWQHCPPAQDAFFSQQPFAIDTMRAEQWLQWIFLPTMRAIIDANGIIPCNFALHPYFEEAFKDKAEEAILPLLCLIKRLDELVKYELNHNKENNSINDKYGN